MYYSPVPVPIALGMLGALAGLIGGGFNQCFPIWVGAATGGSLGCAMCIVTLIIEEQRTAQPVISRSNMNSEPVIIQNIYLVYDIAGRGKDVIPVAEVVQKN